MGRRATLENRYEILKLLGRGGMGSVYLARDLLLDREVALKILKGTASEEGLFRERFKNETRSAASLSHPHVVSVFDAGETSGGVCYMAMEVVSGGNLEERIEREGSLPPDEAVRIAAEVARALSYAHEKGIVHRDVKPQNVLLTESGAVKVADFGIAKAADSTTVTATDLILGTVRYLSPEQATGAEVGPASDLYSLGITLYEMLTGEVPFDAENPIAIAMKHVREAPTPPRRAKPEISPALEAINLKLLSKDPEHRYASAAELSEDLARYLDGQRPVALAAPPASSPAGIREAPPGDPDAETVWLARAEEATSRRLRRRRRNVGVAATLAAAMLGIALLPAASGGFAADAAERLGGLRATVEDTVGDARQSGAVATVEVPPAAATPEVPGLPETSTLVEEEKPGDENPAAVQQAASTGTPAATPAVTPAVETSEVEPAPTAATAPVPSFVPDPGEVTRSEAVREPQPSSRETTTTRRETVVAPDPEPEESEDAVVSEQTGSEKPDPVADKSSLQEVEAIPEKPADPADATARETAPEAGEVDEAPPGTRQASPVSASEIRDATRETIKKRLSGKPGETNP